MSFSFGKNFKITYFGQSHSDCIGVVIDGIPAGFRPDLEELMSFMKRRAPGNNVYSTRRKEKDTPEIISGLNEKGLTCGSPLTIIIKNGDVNDKHYEDLKNKPRPSHADYPAFIKYNGHNDYRGGGSFSGRMTVALCAAGGIAIQILKKEKIEICAHISSIHGIADRAFNPIKKEKIIYNKLRESDFPVIDDNAAKEMKKEIIFAKDNLDSVGGTVECIAVGVKPGLGNPPFDGLENIISKIIYSVPAVHGIEFGSGFSSAALLGSENNDEMRYKNNKVEFLSNNHGGIIGGISTGMPIVFNTVFKATPSIGKKQKTIDLAKKKNADIEIKGRHDPCIVQRAVPCVEAALAIALADVILDGTKNG